MWRCRATRASATIVDTRTGIRCPASRLVGSRRRLEAQRVVLSEIAPREGQVEEGGMHRGTPTHVRATCVAVRYQGDGRSTPQVAAVRQRNEIEKRTASWGKLPEDQTGGEYGPQILRRAGNELEKGQ